VHDVESKLVELIKISGSHAPDALVKKERLEGPAVPGLDDMDGISGQDDVDELLSSLGF
jgi:chemotaxis protein CheZ